MWRCLGILAYCGTAGLTHRWLMMEELYFRVNQGDGQECRGDYRYEKREAGIFD